MEHRLIDYFVEVAAESSDEETVHSGATTRRIVQRIPAVDHDGFALPEGIPYFCLPTTTALAATASAYERKPVFFSFALTSSNGTHAYGFAVHYYEDCAAPHSDNATADSAAVALCWRPRVVCLISHHPFVSLFKEVVSWVFRTRTKSSDVALAQLQLAHACHDQRWFVSPRNSVTQPRKSNWTRTASETGDAPFGTVDAPAASLSAESLAPQRVDAILRRLVLRAARPQPGQVLSLTLDRAPFFAYSVPRSNALHIDDYCIQTLFQCLSLKNVVFVLNALLLEQRVLVHSSHPGLLLPVCQALLALLFPFGWDHVYIPFLPTQLLEYLHAPVPYLIGLHTSSLATRVGAEVFSSCVVVHVDKDNVVAPVTSRVDGSPLVDPALTRLPTRDVDALLRTLANVVPASTTSGSSSVNNVANRSSETTATSPQPSRDAAYELELTFDAGPLGITLEATHVRLLAARKFACTQRQLGASAVVKALPRLPGGQPGPAEQTGLLYPGSFLVAINGESTLDLTFDETIDRLQREPRPVRLRFLNARRPHDSACCFVDRLRALSIVSALQIERTNTQLPWVDTVRGAFAHLFASIFRDTEQFVAVDPPAPSDQSPTGAAATENNQDGNDDTHSPESDEPLHRDASWHRWRRASTRALAVSFDHAAFCKALPTRSRAFARAFVQTQTFVGFVDALVLARVSHAHAFPHVELFRHCVHLVRELRRSGARAAVTLLFERDSTARDVVQLELDPHRASDDGDADASVVDVCDRLEWLPSKPIVATGDAAVGVDDARNRSETRTPMLSTASATAVSKKQLPQQRHLPQTECVDVRGNNATCAKDLLHPNDDNDDASDGTSAPSGGTPSSAGSSSPTCLQLLDDDDDVLWINDDAVPPTHCSTKMQRHTGEPHRRIATSSRTSNQ